MSCFQGKNILITGATGLIGSHIVDRLMKLGAENVIAVGRKKNKLEQVFKEYLGRSDFRIIEQDISEGIPSIDYPIHFIFHAAGPMERKVVENTPVNVILPNLIGTINCLEYLRIQKNNKKIDGRLVLFSSVTVYANNKGMDVIVSEDETDVAGTIEASNASYAESKRMAEVIARSYNKQFGIDVVIARFSTVYGDTRIIPDTAFYEFLKKTARGENIEVNSAEAPRRDNIYIEDAVNGVLLICEKGKSNEAYNISSGGEKGNGAAIDEIASNMARLSNEYFKRNKEDAVCVTYKTPLSGARKPSLMLNNEKLKRLGWNVEYGMDEGIMKTLEWYIDVNE